MEIVTLSTLVADTGETPRTLNHWTDIGILRPEHSTERKGRGNRRFYAAEPLFGERKYALLASAMNRLRLPLVDIKHLIYGDRLHYDPIDSLRQHADPKHLETTLRHRADREEDKKNNPGFVHPYEAALAGEPDVLAVIASRPHDPVVPFRTSYLREMHFFHRNPVTAGTAEAQEWLDKQDKETELAHDQLNQKTHQFNYKMLRNLMSENDIAVVLNLSKIFEPLYRPSATTDD
jgi:DNA-binding transcriptional MerR regulator